MFKRPVFILGAGATKACGGPLTKEILPWASPRRNGGARDRERMLSRLEEFLTQTFCLPRGKRTEDDYPDLPLLMSMIDDAIDRGLQIGSYDAARLREVRAWLNFAIAEVVRWSLEGRRPAVGRPKPHLDLLRPFFPPGQPRAGIEPTVISFNYDLIVDNTMMALGDSVGGTIPDYCCDVASPAYRRRPRFGRLLKPHGSLNWMFCPACQRLDLFYDESQRNYAKAIAEFFVPVKNDPFACTSAECLRPGCVGRIQPVLVTPTQAKDYRNPHLAKVWYEAEQALLHADRVVVVGYSLPSDDVAIVSMLKRSLGRLDPRQVTVIGSSGRKAADSPVGRRYRWLLGDIDWYGGGFERWVKHEWKSEAMRVERHARKAPRRRP